ncbi:actin family protein, partial [Kipferlia bialata]|eukprot:g15693.t1
MAQVSLPSPIEAERDALPYYELTWPHAHPLEIVSERYRDAPMPPAGTTLVVELGRCWIRVGFATEEEPRCIVRALLSRGKGTYMTHYRVGRDIPFERVGTPTVKSPFRDGIMVAR